MRYPCVLDIEFFGQIELARIIANQQTHPDIAPTCSVSPPALKSGLGPSLWILRYSFAYKLDSIMADQRQDARWGRTRLDSGPSNEIDCAAEEDPHNPIARRRRILLVRISDPSARPAREQRRRRRCNAFCSAPTQRGGLRLTGRIRGLVTRQHARGQCWGGIARFRKLDRPQGARDSDKVCRVLDPLMAKEFSPCTNCGIREVIGRTGTGRMPASFRLSSVVPKEWKT